MLLTEIKYSVSNQITAYLEKIYSVSNPIAINWDKNSVSNPIAVNLENRYSVSNPTNWVSPLSYKAKAMVLAYWWLVHFLCHNMVQSKMKIRNCIIVWNRRSAIKQIPTFNIHFTILSNIKESPFLYLLCNNFCTKWRNKNKQIVSNRNIKNAWYYSGSKRLLVLFIYRLFSLLCSNSKLSIFFPVSYIRSWNHVTLLFVYMLVFN